MINKESHEQKTQGLHILSTTKDVLHEVENQKAICSPKNVTEGVVFFYINTTASKITS